MKVGGLLESEVKYTKEEADYFSQVGFSFVAVTMIDGNQYYLLNGYEEPHWNTSDLKPLLK